MPTRFAEMYSVTKLQIHIMNCETRKVQQDKSYCMDSYIETPGIQGDIAETYQFGRSLLRAPRILRQFMHELDGVLNTAGSFIPPPVA